MFENEWLPDAIAMGVTYAEFWKMNPRILKAIAKGYKNKMVDMDYMMWTMGIYVKSAVLVAVDHVLNAKKAKSEYIEKPFLAEAEEETVKKNKESNEQVAVYEMKQRINLLKQQGLPESPI